MSAYCVIDLETTVYNKTGDKVKAGAACPHYRDNKIVLAGWEWSGTGAVHTSERFPEHLPFLGHNPPPMFVGQNIAFDILYLMYEHGFHRKLDRPFLIWDTMLVEYLLTGQREKFISLNELAEKYDLPQKPEMIKGYWDMGMDTEDIPPEELREYLEHDVEVTHGVFKAQRKLVNERGLRNLVYDEMRARVATIYMEYNGMAFSRKTADKLKRQTKTELIDAEQQALELLDRFCDEVHDAPVTAQNQINLASNNHISAIIFGGEIPYETTEIVRGDDGKPYVFKSGKKKGKVKTRKARASIQLPRMVDPDPEWVTPTGKISVTDEVLSKIHHQSLTEFLKYVKLMRKLSKELGTYLEGYSAFTWDDGMIHPKFNHCVTPTGRLSCSNPNLQNLTKTTT